jgi:hypothetical protein
VHGPAHQPVALQGAHGQGEHALADPLDGMVQLAEAVGALAEEDDDHDAPLVSHPVENLAGRAVLDDLIGGGQPGVRY